MMNLLKSIVKLTISGLAFLGPCVYFNNGWLMLISWLPAFFILLYLDND